MFKKCCSALILLLISVLLFTACANSAADDTTPTAEAPQETEPAATEPAATTEPEVTPEPSPSEDAGLTEDARAAYYSVLSVLLNDHVLPDGTDLGYDEASGEDGNQFSICDIDGDGRDELIVVYTTTSVATQMQLIYDYHDGELHCEFSEYPMNVFFDNGVIKAAWSHNQGLGGEFWPFSLYQYDEASDSYALVGMVDAWDKNMSDKDMDGNAFPTDADTTGTGILYYVMQGGEYDTSEPVDISVYEAWYNSYVGDASELTITYTALTEDNINAI